ncbi:hypothetical protein [Streptomyces sp. A012304]|uniref:hypothetical protein n=1 Tax=Streptomyces sp. A012304 TaxID=375446 RepID=UPI00222FB9DA|nr:hypothetical protein [Streptomyces sp. A012304]GKQ33884.1 hypothetical protein ALMP_04350 [Streptomyces sp. A012304]
MSQLIGDLSRKGFLERREDERDRRRRIVALAAEHEPAISAWLAPGAEAWRRAPAPLTPDQRRLFLDTLLAYEAGVAADGDRVRFTLNRRLSSRPDHIPAGTLNRPFPQGRWEAPCVPA